MSLFLTIPELESRIGSDELLQIAGEGAWNGLEGRSVSEVKVSAALAHANSLILGYVRARYPSIATLVAVDQPDVLKGLAADIARHRLRNEAGNQSLVSEEAKQRYDEALRLLRDMQSGKFDLVLAETASEEAKAGFPAPDGAVGNILTGQSNSTRSDRILEGYR